LSEEKNNSKFSSSFSNFIFNWLPLILSILVGLVFLVSGLIKAFEMELFIRQIGDYDIISNPALILIGAWGIIITEFCLGTSLIINYKPGISIPPAALLIIIFIGTTGWAWYTGATDDCGCFGSWVERTPGEAIVEDIFLLAALLFSWKYNKKVKNWPFHLKEFLIIFAFLAGLVLPLLTGTLPDRINRLITGTGEGEYEAFNLEGFTSFDLSTGRYIIIIMSTDCSHCREEVDNLISISSDNSLPKVLALTMNDEEQREDFIDEFEPGFNIYQIPDDDFWRLLEDGDIPRTILINDGRILKKWDYKTPEIEAIKLLLK